MNQTRVIHYLRVLPLGNAILLVLVLLHSACSASSTLQPTDDNVAEPLSEPLLSVEGSGSFPVSVLSLRFTMKHHGLVTDHRLRLQREESPRTAGYRSYTWDGNLLEQSESTNECLFIGYVERRQQSGKFAPVEGSFAAINHCSKSSDGASRVTGLVATESGQWDLRWGGAPMKVLNHAAGQSGTSGSESHSRASNSYRLTPLKTGHTREPVDPSEIQFTRLTPEILSAPVRELMPFREGTEAETKYVELLVFNDATLVNGNADRAEADALGHIGVLNSLFAISQIRPRVRVSIVGIVNMIQDPYTVAIDGRGEVNPAQLFAAFGIWAFSQEFPANDMRLLLTGYDLQGGTVGIAPVSSACDPRGSIVVVQSDNIGGEPIIAAHEMGHTFGMVHDGSDNGCQAGRNLMSASACNDCLTFSACSLGEFEEFLDGPDYRLGELCLDNVPVQPAATQCGDGIVTGAEECDCGERDCGDLDPCCDGTTCRLNAGAQCSAFNDGCCTDCRISTAQEQKICRAAFDSCDTEEICDGLSAQCPADTFLESGLACEDNRRNPGQCFQGGCVSLTSTCEDAGPRVGAQFTGPPATCPRPCEMLACSTDGIGCSIVSDIVPPEGSSCDGGGQCINGECVVAVDDCPNDAAKTTPGQCGCGAPENPEDDDADGTFNCADLCPEDPEKTAPGRCGCGAAETLNDADGDGAPDCVDACPEDPNKTVAGACGCGESEQDSDNDGSADCVDACPNDGTSAVPPCESPTAEPTTGPDGEAVPGNASTPGAEAMPGSDAVPGSGAALGMESSDPMNAPTLQVTASSDGGCAITTRTSGRGANTWALLLLLALLQLRRRTRCHQSVTR